MPGGKFTDSLITENLKVATEYFKATVSKVQDDAVDKIKNSGGSIGFIPFKINFTMDGLSGIKIYNELVLDTSFLPQGYSKTLKFIVTGVDHKLSKNDWETTISTTLIPTTSKISKITGSLKISLKEEVTLETPENLSTPLSNNTSLTSAKFNIKTLWMYFTHQQGPDGASQHYNVAYKNGKYEANVPPVNIYKNWPGGKTSSSGVKASDVNTLYSTDQKKLALAFIDVWTQRINDNLAVLKTLKGNNRTGYAYSNIKNIFDQVGDSQITGDVLYQFAYIENGLEMDTDGPTYKSMFQLNKAYYPDIVNKWKEGPGHKAGFIKYGQSNFLGFMQDLFPKIKLNFTSFVKSTGYPN